ncbi:hypothetical protein CAP35_14475 [Chitinophagaceae bacterium IBVUCB1]|nr:hypothetical protein CAP35_14475 [Chitinophagaceae bacterium IBVUCB1]
MELKDGIKTYYAKSRAAWRAWLDKNHAKETSVWLIIYKKDSGVASVYYPEAVEEALCYGWIDSKPNKRDEQSYYQFFSKRNPKSKWSGINKASVARLEKAGLMMPAGSKMVELAKATGTWDALNDIDAIVIPADLMAALKKHKGAWQHFDAFPKSVKRGILEWITNAKRPETRAKRIAETAEKAAQNIRANQYRQ